MRSGLLRHKVSIQEKTSTSDGMGGYTNVWADVYVTRAAIWPMKAAEILDAMKLELEVNHKIRIRHPKSLNITADMRVEWIDLIAGAKYFNIVSIINVDKRNVLLDLICIEDDTPTVIKYIEKYSSAITANAGQRVAQGAANAYVTAEFTNIAEEYTVRRITLSMYSGQDGGDFTWTCEIREWDGAQPSDVILATATFTGNLDGTPTPYNIDFNPGCVLEASTAYCVVIHRGGLGDLDHWIAFAYLNTGTESVLTDEDGLQAWTTITDDTATLYLVTYTKEVM